MRLKELEQFTPITIQMHDNPDADAIASGYALYKYFTHQGIETRLIYSGRYEIQKSNLKLFIETLEIPVQYVEKSNELIPGLLITVDSQYGAGNITKFKAEHIAVIDHHQIEINDQNLPFCEIQSQIGSCSTIVWKMIKNEGYDIKDDVDMGTALFYGLYMDTNQFSEMGNPLDMDMREDVNYDKTFINQLRNSNLSLTELEIAGVALIRYIYNEDYRYAIIMSKPCDPNLLGLISDFLLQVDKIDTCVVYNVSEEGFKFSVRSCVREVRANEMAQFLAEGLGSGGGHNEKAGGFISRARYEAIHAGVHTENYFGRKMTQYFESFDIIDTKNYEVSLEDMKCFYRKKLPIGYVKLHDILPVGTPVMIRTLEGDTQMEVSQDIYLMIGLKGEAYPIERKKFEEDYQETEETFFMEVAYTPKVKNRVSGIDRDLLQFAKTCYVKERTIIHARVLDKAVKVFTKWNRDSYMLGKVGDYLVVKDCDLHDIYVIEKDIFGKIYEEVSN